MLNTFFFPPLSPPLTSLTQTLLLSTFHHCRSCQSLYTVLSDGPPSCWHCLMLCFPTYFIELVREQRTCRALCHGNRPNRKVLLSGYTTPCLWGPGSGKNSELALHTAVLLPGSHPPWSKEVRHCGFRGGWSKSPALLSTMCSLRYAGPRWPHTEAKGSHIIRSSTHPHKLFLGQFTKQKGKTTYNSGIYKSYVSI